MSTQNHINLKGDREEIREAGREWIISIKQGGTGSTRKIAKSPLLLQYQSLSETIKYSSRTEN